MKVSKTVALVAAICAAVLALGVAVVSAAGPGEVVKVKTTTSINPYGNGGKISAANSNCLEGRTVVVKQQGYGKIGSAKTNDKGAWKSEPTYKGSPPLKVWAEVKPITQATAGPIYKCLAAVSKTVTINGG
jgi:hypothetical protein